MKKTFALLSLVCSAALLQGCQSTAPLMSPAIRVESAVRAPHSDNTPGGWYRLGQYHQSKNQFEQAADAYRAILAQDPAHIAARNALATVYVAQNKFDEAIAEFREVLRTNPGLAHVHNNLGYTYFLKYDYSAAITALGTAIALEPGNARAFGNLALVYEQLGDSARARMASLRAAALDRPPIMATSAAAVHATPYRDPLSRPALPARAGAQPHVRRPSSGGGPQHASARRVGTGQCPPDARPNRYAGSSDGNCGYGDRDLSANDLATPSQHRNPAKSTGDHHANNLARCSQRHPAARSGGGTCDRRHR